MQSAPLTSLALLMLASGSFSSATVAEASVELAPSIGAVCVHERTVLRGKDGRSILDSTSDNPVELVRVTVCDRERTACMVQGEEVHMALCR
jgi:hypothetical protein